MTSNVIPFPVRQPAPAPLTLTVVRVGDWEDASFDPAIAYRALGEELQDAGVQLAGNETPEEMLAAAARHGLAASMSRERVAK